MTTPRTTPPRNYLPPSQSDIQEMARKVGLKAFSQDLVEDLCNIQAGGSYIPEHQIVDKLRRSDYLDKDLTIHSRGNYIYKGREYLVDSSDNYVKDKSKARELVCLKEVNYHRNIQNFVRSLDISNVPGVSPLEKSLSLVKLLSTQEGGDSSNGQGDEDSLPIFNQTQEKLADKINNIFETISNLDYQEKQLLDFTGPLGDKGQLSMAEDMLNGKEVMLQIKRNLDKLVKLRTGKHVKLIPDPNGSEIRYRLINDFSEIDRLNPVELIYNRNYLNYRIISGTSTIRERCSKQEKKMLLYILIDCSSSMHSGNNFLKAGGVLMNRLKAVLEGEAEVVFSFFHSRLGKEYVAETVSEARDLMKRIKYENFNEGSTEIALCIKEAIKRINTRAEKNTHLGKRQLMVITDGCDDTTSLKLEHLRGITLNTIIVGGTNDHLLKIARQSGGVAISNI
jgi:uncharacterized protein with von Willebrand factor type A (vWA) domain